MARLPMTKNTFSFIFLLTVISVVIIVGTSGGFMEDGFGQIFLIVCACAIVPIGCAIWWQMRQQKELDNTDKLFGLVKGSRYKIILDTGRIYKNLTFMESSKYFNQHSGGSKIINGQKVKGNISLWFYDTLTKRDIKIRAINIASVSQVEK